MTAADAAQPQPPRAIYAAATLLAAVLATGCAWFVASGIGGSEAALPAAAITAGACAVGLLPALVGSATHFGVYVMAASVTRLLLVIFAAVLLTEVGGLPRRPLWLGAASGAAIALVAESILSIAVIASMQRRPLPRPTDRGPAAPAEQESGVTC